MKHSDKHIMLETTCLNNSIKEHKINMEFVTLDNDIDMGISEIDMLSDCLKSVLKFPKVVIAIDNDECIGSWGDLSLLYSILKYEYSQEPDIDLFVKIMNDTYSIRPYVKDLFNKIISFKSKGIVCKVFMCTAASNKNGWVTFLAKILERWIGEKIYDDIIFGELIEEWHKCNKTNPTNNVGYIKNMDMIREILDFKYTYKTDEFTIIAIDDRPSNIMNAIAIGVSPYRIAVNIYQVLKVYYPDNYAYLMSKHDFIINDSWERYLKNPILYSKAYGDNDIFKGIEYIEKIIYS